MAKGNKVAGFFGLLLGMVGGVLSYYWYKGKFQAPKDSKVADTGKKDANGNPIVEVTGVGGDDNGKKVQGYVLSNKIADIKLPLTVVVMPNQNLFGAFKVGDRVVFSKPPLNDELIYHGTINGSEGDYAVWLPDLVKTTLGVSKGV